MLLESPIQHTRCRYLIVMIPERLRDAVHALAARQTTATTDGSPSATAAAAFASCRQALRVDEVYHSNAIRGNRLTREQTEELLKRGVTVGGLTLREHLEVVNLNSAIDHAEVLAASTAPITEHAVR